MAGITRSKVIFWGNRGFSISMLIYPKVSPKILGVERVELQQNGYRVNDGNNRPTTMTTLTNKTGEKRPETRETEQSHINPMGPCPDGASKNKKWIWRSRSTDAFFGTTSSSTLLQNMLLSFAWILFQSILEQLSTEWKLDESWPLGTCFGTKWLSVSSVLLLTWRTKRWHCNWNAGRTSNDWNT